MLKLFSRGGRAAFALTFALLAAAAALAQDSNGARKQTPDAQTVSAKDGAQPEATGRRNEQRRAPLTAGEKIRRSFHSAFLSPAPYAESALSAGITQRREDRLPNKTTGDEIADWGSRAARNFATGSTTKLFASGLYPALFRQDPRYEPSEDKGVGRRTLHAVSRVFVMRGDGGELQPNYSRFAGALTGSALANLWEHSTPGHDRVGTDATLRRFERSFVNASISNVVFKEFGPDIKRIFRH